VSSVTPLFIPGIGRVVVSPIDDAENPVSTVFEFQYRVINRVSFFKQANWNVTGQGISTQVASAFNVSKRMHVFDNVVMYGLDHAIVWPIDRYIFIPAYAWNIDRRSSTTKKFAWKVIQRKSSSKKIAFDNYATTHAHSALGWNVHLLVRVPGLLIENWYNQIVQPTMHPIDLQNYVTPPYLQYNVTKRISTRRAMRFNTNIKASAQLKSSFKATAIKVICQKIIQWETLMRL
jgi:hypothetical protein